LRWERKEEGKKSGLTVGVLLIARLVYAAAELGNQTALAANTRDVDGTAAFKVLSDAALL
jgi:hypothetical protein